MKRTIFSSFMFLYPLNKAYQYGDQWTMNLSAIGLGLSIANHSHAWHQDQFRRKLFKYVDIVYMHAFIARTVYNSLASLQCITSSIIILMSIINTFLKLGTEDFEHYTENQKLLHTFFHVYAITSLCMLHEQCYWKYN